MIRKKAATKTAKKTPKKPAARAHKVASTRGDGAAAAKRSGGTAASKREARMREAADWRTRTLERVRRIIQGADPEVVEERKWAKAATPDGVPVWSHDGILCTGETYRNVVKLTFARGASLKDPARLFNSSLEGKARRAIDIHENDAIDEAALKKLIQAAVALNVETSEPRRRK